MLKQTVALKLVDIDFNLFTFNKAPRVCRRYQLSHEGSLFSEDPSDVNVPVQINDVNCGSNADPNNDQTTKSGKRNGRGKHYLPVIKTLLLIREAWDAIDNEEAYTLPGFANLPKVLYCSDWEHLPLASTNDSFIVKDCQLSLGPTHTTVRELDIDGKSVSIRRGQCEGVKVCSGAGCNRPYIVSRSQKLNR